MIIIGTQMRKTCTPKNTKKTIVSGAVEQFFVRGEVVKSSRRHAINEIARCLTCFIPK
jgi:hypothetical protein